MRFGTGVDIKLPTYWSTPFNQICIRSVNGSSPILIQIPYRASSLESLIRDGEPRVINTTSAETWRGLAPDFNTTVLGNSGCSGVAGFNVGDKNFIRTRFGIVTREDQTGCDDKVEGIGVGLETIYPKRLAGGHLDSNLRFPQQFSIHVREGVVEEGGGAGDAGDEVP